MLFLTGNNSVFHSCFLLFNSQVLDSLVSPSQDVTQDLGITGQFISHLGFCNSRLAACSLTSGLPLQSQPRNMQTIPVQPLTLVGQGVP